MLEATNMTGPEGQLKDPWKLEGLTREQVKKAYTPKLYGSDKSVVELWEGYKLNYTIHDLQIANTELQNGMFGTANKFKEFIINNCKPQEEMEIVSWKDTFKVFCNRHKRVKKVAVKYDLFDTESGGIRQITHMKTKAVADLEGFRRYFVTCLVHNLDGQVANTVAGKCFDKYGFCLDIHDAFIVSPIAAADVRMWYAEEMDKIYANRKEILSNFFRSIGIGANAMPEWEAVMDSVVPVENFKCRGEVLK